MGGGQLDGQREPVGEPADLRDAGALPRSGLQAGLDRRARSRNSAAASGRGHPPSGTTASPTRPSTTRLVARTCRSGQRGRRSSRSAATPARTCSQLSRTSRPDAVAQVVRRRRLRRAPGRRAPRSRRAPRAAATCPGPRGASSTKPSSGSGRSRAASIASRDLPLPPGPTSVTSRCLIAAATAASSEARPTNEVSGAGSTGECALRFSAARTSRSAGLERAG